MRATWPARSGPSTLCVRPREELEAIDGIGEVVAGEIREFFDSEQNERVIEGLLEYVDPEELEVETGDALDGLTFVFTGSLSGMTRGDAQAVVEQYGANATSSVSGNTDYLVAGDSPGQSKTDDADANDVPILDERAFRELLADNGIEYGVHASTSGRYRVLLGAPLGSPRR